MIGNRPAARSGMPSPMGIMVDEFRIDAIAPYSQYTVKYAPESTPMRIVATCGEWNLSLTFAKLFGRILSMEAAKTIREEKITSPVELIIHPRNKPIPTIAPMAGSCSDRRKLGKGINGERGRVDPRNVGERIEKLRSETAIDEEGQDFKRDYRGYPGQYVCSIDARLDVPRLPRSV